MKSIFYSSMIYCHSVVAISKKRSLLQPPIAQQKPHELTKHDNTRIDNYYWLNERRENPEVIAYLEAENAYTDAALAHTNDAAKVVRRKCWDASSKRIFLCLSNVMVTFTIHVNEEVRNTRSIVVKAARMLKKSLLNGNEMAEGSYFPDWVAGRSAQQQFAGLFC